MCLSQIAGIGDTWNIAHPEPFASFAVGNLARTGR